MASVDFGNFDSLSGIAVQPDGRILLVGSSNDSMAIARLLSHGALDSSFGTGGKVQLPNAYAAGTVVLNDGKILVSCGPGFRVARFLPDGMLDTAFGNQGYAEVPVGTNPQWSGALAVQPDGKLVVASRTEGFSLARYHADGSPDTSFGSGGVAIRTLPGEIAGMTLQSSGRIVVAGIIRGFISSQMLVLGLTPTGASAWEERLSFCVGNWHRAFCVGRLSGDRLLVAGGTDPQGIGTAGTARLHASGMLDASFGNAACPGLVVTPGEPPVFSMIPLPNDEFFTNGPGSFGVTRYLANGSVDTAFGDNGHLFGPLAVQTSSLALQDPGAILAAGNWMNGGQRDFAVVRYRDPAVIARTLPLGCGVNPPGSMSIIAGVPRIGGFVDVGLHNPVATQAAGSATALLLAAAADPARPCGTQIPGWGMTAPGTPGELLVRNPLAAPLVGTPWTGTPIAMRLTIPNDCFLIGLSLFAQGALLDFTPGARVPIGLTDAVELQVGNR